MLNEALIIELAFIAALCELLGRQATAESYVKWALAVVRKGGRRTKDERLLVETAKARLN